MYIKKAAAIINCVILQRRSKNKGHVLKFQFKKNKKRGKYFSSAFS